MPGHPSDTEYDAEARTQRTDRIAAEAQARADERRDIRDLPHRTPAHLFFDALKALYFIDQDDLASVGINFPIKIMSAFRADPARYMRAQPAPIQEAVWKLIDPSRDRGTPPPSRTSSTKPSTPATSPISPDNS